MDENRLKVVASENKTPPSFPKSTSRREETQAKFDRMWLQHPEKFDPFRNCMETRRIERSIHILETIELKEKKVVELGCGTGVFSRRLRDKGAIVDAVDISENALKILKERDITNINPIKDFVPRTILKDENYDIVAALDLIAYLHPEDHRIFFAEIARLMKKEAYVLCSTPFDINTEDPLIRFSELAETEFEILKWKFSHHRLLIKLIKFFDAPRKFTHARRDKIYREKQIEKRTSFYRWWFKVNSKIPLWTFITYITKPITNFLNTNHTMMDILEKICRFLWSDSGISHAIFLGKIKPLPPLPKDLPIERKSKKQVWE